MVKGTVKVVNPLGLHARAAAQLVKVAGSFSSTILLHRSDSQLNADAKSILSVLSLAAPVGTVLEIYIEGNDEDEALNRISLLFKNGFGEL